MIKKIIKPILVGALVGIALHYCFYKEEPIAAVDDEEVDDSCNSSEESCFYCEELDYVASKLYKYVQEKNIDSLATLFVYPITRCYPTRDIINEEEFVERYDEIFDDAFCAKIIDDPCNWSAMGWRGYMYDLGDLWLDYDESKIRSVNVYSELGERRRELSIEREKSTLHESILVHATEPICSFKTKNGEWYGRIDYISPVDNIDIQLALYESTTPIDCAPDFLMLGVKDVQGSAHNTYYRFKGDAFNFVVDNPTIYECGRYPYTLTIEHNYGEVYEGEFDIDWVYWEDLREDQTI